MRKNGTRIIGSVQSSARFGVVAPGFDSADVGTVLRGAAAPTTGGLTDAGGGTTTGVDGDDASAWPAGAGDKTIGLVGAADGAIVDAAMAAGAAGGRA